MNKKMKLSLLGILIASSVLTIILPIVSCSASSEEEEIITNNTLFANEDDLKAVEKSVAKLLKYELQFTKTNQAQKNIVNEWKENEMINSAYMDAIKNKLNFKNSDGKDFKGIDVIESVIFYNNGEVPSAGGIILSPKLKVIINSKYTSPSDILISSQSLGVALDDITIENQSQANDYATIPFNNVFSDAKTRDEQKELLNSWKIGEEVPGYLDYFFFGEKNFVNFKLGNLSLPSKDVMESVTFYSVPELPNKGESVENIILKINFKLGYDTPQDFMLSTSNIGWAL
ncbi:MAG: hypothetical protein ACRDCF_02145 [Mycoplasmoidaceae bacterium]